MNASNSNRKTITGYVTPQQFGPFIMPVPAQNSCLREYANTYDFSYNIPQCEHIFPNCYMQLFSTLNSADANSAIVMYSFHMMPKTAEQMGKLLEIQQAKNLTFHFVLEKKIANSAEELKELAKTLYITDLIKQNDVRREALRTFL